MYLVYYPPLSWHVRNCGVLNQNVKGSSLAGTAAVMILESPKGSL